MTSSVIAPKNTNKYASVSAVAATGSVKPSDVFNPPFSTLIEHQHPKQQQENLIQKIDTNPAERRRKHVSVDSVVGHSVAFSFRDYANTNSNTSSSRSSSSRATASTMTTAATASTVSVIGGAAPVRRRYLKSATLENIKAPPKVPQQPPSHHLAYNIQQEHMQVSQCTRSCPVHCCAGSSANTFVPPPSANRYPPSYYENYGGTTTTAYQSKNYSTSSNVVATSSVRMSHRPTTRARGVTRMAWDDEREKISSGRYHSSKPNCYYGYHYNDAGATKVRHRDQQRVTDSESSDSNYTTSTIYHRDLPPIKTSEPPALHRIINGGFTVRGADSNLIEPPKMSSISSRNRSGGRSVPPRSPQSIQFQEEPTALQKRSQSTRVHVGSSRYQQQQTTEAESQQRTRSASARRLTDPSKDAKKSRSIVESRAFVSLSHRPGLLERSNQREKVLIVSSMERDRLHRSSPPTAPPYLSKRLSDP